MWNVDKFKVKTFIGGCLISCQQIEELSRLAKHTFYSEEILNENNFWILKAQEIGSKF